MNIARMGMMARRVIIQFRRDHRTLGLIFVVPVVIITLLAYLMRSTGGDVSLAVVNEDSGAGAIRAGQLFVTALKLNDRLQVSDMSRADAEAALKEGRVKAAVILSPDFSRSLATDRRLAFQLLLEGSNPMDTSSVMQALSQTAQSALGAAGAIMGAAAVPKIDIQTSYVYGGPQFDVLDLFAPAYISFFIFFLVFLLTCVSFLRERMQGTMERLMATPAGRGEIVGGYTLGFGLFAVLQSLVVLLWSVYVLNVHHVGSLLLIFLIEAILTAVAVGMGIFLSVFARNELQAVQFIPIVIIPQAFLSGLLWQISDLPGWLQPVAYLMPMTYGIRALRDVMIKGFGIIQVAPDLTIMLVLAAGTLVLAALSLRREIA